MNLTPEAIAALGAASVAFVGSVGLNVRQWAKTKRETTIAVMPLEQAAAAQWQTWAAQQLDAQAERHAREEEKWDAERVELLGRIQHLEATVNQLWQAVNRLSKTSTPPRQD